MGLSYCKPFALPELKQDKEIRVHVSTAQGAERNERSLIQAKRSEKKVTVTIMWAIACSYQKTCTIASVLLCLSIAEPVCTTVCASIESVCLTGPDIVIIISSAEPVGVTVTE